MKDVINLRTPALREIILTPIEVRQADDTPILDEEGNPLLSEQGLPICEG